MTELHTESNEQLPSLGQMQETLRRAFASGTAPVEKEIELRTYLATMLIVEFEHSRRQQDLHDAIEHNKTILRRLEPTSPARPERLDTLSYAFMSEYGMSNSRRALDEAVRYGKLARGEAMAAGLQETKPQIYCRILHNLGYALSHRNAAVASVADLDEAIDCAREIRRCRSSAGPDFSTNTINVISRLRMRYVKRNDPADYEEVMQLITEQLSASAPGTVLHGMIILHLGEMAAEKYKRTDAIEDLEEAIHQLNAGLTTLPRGHEKRFELEARIGQLYSSRHEKSSDLADIRSAMLHLDTAVALAPLSSPTRATYLVEFMHRLRDYVDATTSLSDVDRAIAMGKKHLAEMPKEFSQRHVCQSMFVDVLGRRYLLVRTIDSLIEPLEIIETLCYEYNNRVEKSGSRAPVDSSQIYAFRTNLLSLSHTPDGPAKTAATMKLHELVSTACTTQPLITALADTQKEYGKQLQVYADLAELGRCSPREQFRKERAS